VALLAEQRKSVRDNEEPGYWMYDSGYLLFQVRIFSWEVEILRSSRCPGRRIIICHFMRTNSMEQKLIVAHKVKSPLRVHKSHMNAVHTLPV
jgi:hypothetical protein